MKRETLISIFMTVAVGGALWFVVNLEPVWWPAWIVPGLLFWLTLRTNGWASRGYVLLAAFIGALRRRRRLARAFRLSTRGSATCWAGSACR